MISFALVVNRIGKEEGNDEERFRYRADKRWGGRSCLIWKMLFVSDFLVTYGMPNTSIKKMQNAGSSQTGYCI